MSDPNEALRVVDTFWPPLESAELEDILEPWSLRNPRVLRQGGRPLTRTALFQCDQGEFFVKQRATATVSEATLTAQHAFMSELISAGFPTPELRHSQSGRTFEHREGFFTEVQHLAEGLDLYAGRHTWQPFLDPLHALSVGELARKLRSISEASAVALPSSPGVPGTSFQAARAPSIQEFLFSRKGLREFLSGRPKWKEELNGIESAMDQIRPWAMTVPDTWVHSDLQANNFLFEQDQAVSVIDFHLAGRAPALFDLAVALDRNCLLWLDILSGNDEAIDYAGIEGLISGYGRLSIEESLALEHLLAVCQVDFAASLLEYYWHVEKNPDRATWSWEVYLVGHTNWYLSEPGQRFSQTFRRILT